jgi:hypothetical protein
VKRASSNSHRPFILGLLVFAALGGGCVQLVAFGQPVVGQTDEAMIESRSQSLCDGDVAMGSQAYCDVSCALDPTSGAHTCGQRLTVEGPSASLEVGGLYEVELVVNACAEAEQGWSLEDEAGASVTIRGAALEARPVEGEPIHRAEDFLTVGECAERSVLVQHHRLDLVQADRRLCSEGLPGLPERGASGRWRLRWTPAVRSIELCLRARRASGASPR